MVIATKPLMALTAGDLMTETLVLIPQTLSVQAAARLLSQNQVSGAPVVNEEGVCVGVLSAMDFVRWAEKGQSAWRCMAGSADYCQTWQIIEPDGLPNDAVGNYMTTDPVTVAPSVRIAELARMMVDAHIHRIIVVDEHGHPQGLVSSTDILAALAYAVPARGMNEL